MNDGRGPLVENCDCCIRKRALPFSGQGKAMLEGQRDMAKVGVEISGGRGSRMDLGER